MNQKQLDDIERYAQMAFDAAGAATAEVQRLRRELAFLEERLEVLEGSQRQSQVDSFEQRIIDTIEQRMKVPSSDPPANGTVEVKTHGGERVRAPWGVAIALAFLVFATVAMWQAPEIVKVLTVRK